MSYRLKTHEALASGIRRIAREQLEGALCKIVQPPAGNEIDAIHDLRRHIKKTRALLRLVRGEIGEKIYREENRQLRNVGREFSGLRDAGVRLQVIDGFRKQVDEEDAFPATARTLEQELLALTDSFPTRQEQATAALQRVCDRIEGWPLEDLGMDDLCCALKEAYRRGRKCFRCVCAEPTPENFHSWRKRTKDLWYQARILQKLNEPVLCAMADSAQRLGHHLGKLHDLAFFRTWLQAVDQAVETERTVLLGLVCKHEHELERIALDLGARFFAEKPSAFERRVIRYARDWPTP
jgi:CHAD domain-containing protein